MRRLLVVANDCPFPPHHGGAVDMWNRILGLKNLGFAVDLVATVKSRPSDGALTKVRSVVENLWVVMRERGMSAALSLQPFQVSSRKALRHIAFTEQYEAVLLESEYVSPVLENSSLNVSVRILRAENDEARFFRELGRSVDGWIEHVFYRIEALKFDVFSRRIRRKFDLIWFISGYEMRCHLDKYPEDASKATFLPPDPGVRNMSVYSGAGREVLFVGSLTLPPNVEGLKWYVDYVHPVLSEIDGYSLVIAGRTGGFVPSAIMRFVNRYPNISFYPDPVDLGVLYRRAAVFVNPVLRGAGLKVKTVHALHAGLPVVSTSIGAEGTGLVGGEHVIIADSASEFARGVSTMLQDRSRAEDLVSSAQSFLLGAYDQERTMRDSLSTVLSAPSIGS